MKRGLLALSVWFLAGGQSPVASAPEWNATSLGQLRHWVDAAPEDALPRLDMHELDAATASGNPAAIDLAADALALRLGRMHLLGTGARSGWKIADSDAGIALGQPLRQALTVGTLDQFLATLRPQHPDYAALRAAYALERDPVRHGTLAGNMERWRWMPHVLPQDYVLVNAASFEARLWRQGQQAGAWPVIVGKSRTPTPIFAATITGVTFNPWWEVPGSIVRESVGALIRRSPAAARQRGFVWSGGKVRQRPGPGNSLGLMKLVMPNPYGVYLHDTPSRDLFGRDVRALSHGCVRVGDAPGFATAVLGGARSRAEVDAIAASGKTSTVGLPRPLPVYVTYFTAGLRGDGTLGYFPDIYGRDAKALARRMAREESCAV